LSRFCRKTEKALIKKRGQDRDDCDHYECSDSIKLIELRKIVQEKLENCDAEQSQTRIPHRPGGLTNANDQEQQRERRPRDALTHVAREVSGKLKCERRHARPAEVIGNLDV
jgi:hypothetical protein